ncbi:hypothetical protein V8F06_000016 [Rhypophila decipiens]
MAHLSGKARIQLVPWDVNSAHHQSRLFQQRVACGFGTESVELWTAECKAGTMAMYWITLADDCPNRAEYIAAHMEKYPEDAIPLADTASTIFKNPRLPPTVEFFPVGHVGLAYRPEKNAKIGLPPDIPISWLTGIYTSWALQGVGIGYATMQIAEKTAADIGTSKGQGKVTMVLDTITASFQFDETYKRLYYEERGLEVPKISLQQWYEKQGYVQFHDDPEGNTWTKGETTLTVPLVYYKKLLH